MSTIMLSFDFAENILFLNLIEEPGIFYFRSRRKIDCFGITNEKTNEQLSYIIDECHRINKGPNVVLSMLSYYCEIYVPIFVINSPAQNKNLITIAYLAYLVKHVKLYPEIKLSFLISGHTKLAPESHFGLIKKCIKEENCYSILNLVGSDGRIQKSATNNYEITYKDPITKTKNFQWLDWKKIFKNKFLPITGIRNWHHIVIQQESDSILVADDINQEMRSVPILKDNVIFINLSVAKVEELSFFKSFVPEEHKVYMDISY